MNSKKTLFTKPSKKNVLLSFLLVLVLHISPSKILGQQLKKQSTAAIQNNWIAALNNAKSLVPFYIKNSGILVNNSIYIGVEDISMQLQNLIKNDDRISSYKILGEHQLVDYQKFELGEYNTENENVFTTIIGWKLGDSWAKEFEVIYKKSNDFVLEEDSVLSGRKKWEQLANLHRPDSIATEVFSKNGKYFHRGTQFKVNEIDKAYSYMSNESYSITLEAVEMQQVNSRIIFEIGIYRAGGEGLYTLIWIKEKNKWNLLLDFNF